MSEGNGALASGTTSTELSLRERERGEKRSSLRGLTYNPLRNTQAKMLAKKFASLYYLLEDMLSPQKHYDWGLRAIKSVLVVAGSLLRAEEGQVGHTPPSLDLASV